MAATSAGSSSPSSSTPKWLSCSTPCCCSSRTSLWFAAMNYSVHSVMYGYFALMTTKYRKYITPYAIFITLAQLAQMLVGMFVTIKAMMWQDVGAECHVNKTNSVLGLTMYASYFLLFFKLFVENYVTQTRRRGGEGNGLPPKKKSFAEAARALSRTISSKVNPQVDSDGEQDTEESSSKRDAKKLN